MVDFAALLKKKRADKQRHDPFCRGYLDIEARYNPNGQYAKPMENGLVDGRMFRDWQEWHIWAIAITRSLYDGVDEWEGSSAQFVCPHCIPEDHMAMLTGGDTVRRAVPNRIGPIDLRRLVDELYGGPYPVNLLWTYNGRMRATKWDNEHPYHNRETNEKHVRVGFDLGIIYESLGLDLELAGPFQTKDLVVECWARSLYGGLKAMEARVGFQRPAWAQMAHKTDCVALWEEYRTNHDYEILAKLLDYNLVDCMGLQHIEKGLRNNEINEGY